MFSGNNKKEMTCEEWLRDMDGRESKLIVDHLVNRSAEIKKQAAAESLQQDNHAAYVVEALLCEDVNNLDVARLEKAYEYLLIKQKEDEAIQKKQKSMMIPDHNAIPATIINSIKVTLHYLALKRNIITPAKFTEELINATQDKHPALVILPKANLSKLNLSANDESPAANLCCANLHGADLSDCNMQGVQFNNANLEDACLVGTDFRRCDLGGANLAKVNWLNTKFGSGQDAAKMEGADLLPVSSAYSYSDERDFEKFLEECRIHGISELVVLDNINRNFMNNKYTLEEKLNLYNKAFYHPCFNTKVGMFSISKDADYCKKMIGGQIKALKYNILEKPENLRRDLQVLADEIIAAQQEAQRMVDYENRANQEVLRTAELAAKAAVVASGDKQYDKYAVDEMVEAKKAADVAVAKAMLAKEAAAKAAEKAAQVKAKNTEIAKKTSCAFKEANAQAGRLQGKK